MKRAVSESIAEEMAGQAPLFGEPKSEEELQELALFSEPQLAGRLDEYHAGKAARDKAKGTPPVAVPQPLTDPALLQRAGLMADKAAHRELMLSQGLITEEEAAQGGHRPSRASLS